VYPGQAVTQSRPDGASIDGVVGGQSVRVQFLADRGEAATAGARRATGLRECTHVRRASANGVPDLMVGDDGAVTDNQRALPSKGARLGKPNLAVKAKAGCGSGLSRWEG
jgi:hypothetical protein